MSTKTKNVLWGVFAVVLVAVFAIWMIANPGPDHIEDTNGADNYSLQRITEQDVIDQQMGSRGTVTKSETRFNFGSVGVSDGKKYSSDKFTGVYVVGTPSTIFKGSDIHVMLGEFKIKAGNFAFFIVFDGKVVGKVEPDKDGGFSEFILENVNKTGSLEYVIAGESASFEFIALSDLE